MKGAHFTQDAHLKRDDDDEEDEEEKEEEGCDNDGRYALINVCRNQQILGKRPQTGPNSACPDEPHIIADPHQK